MNTLIYYSFNIAILALVILIIGMIKPKWIFFWMDSPGRFPVAFVSAALIMAAGTLFGEGNKQLQVEKEQLSKQQAAQGVKPAATEVPDLH